MTAPRLLYLHGFASSTHSRKAVAFRDDFARRGSSLAILDLRLPSLAELRLSAMIDAVRAAIGEPADRAVLVGSSLGGLTAARVAERDPRVCGLVLLAPAFRLAERWREQLGDRAWQAWQSSGWHPFHDHATGRPTNVHFEFAAEAERFDRADRSGGPDVRVPTLIFHGRRDDVVPIARSYAFARDKPHVELRELDDDHEMVASIPQLVAETANWLAPWGVHSPLGM